jgi:hypothetical protein
MRWKDVRWGAALGGMLLAEVLTIAAAFAWVFLYSLVAASHLLKLMACHLGGRSAAGNEVAVPA